MAAAGPLPGNKVALGCEKERERKGAKRGNGDSEQQINFNLATTANFGLLISINHLLPMHGGGGGISGTG